MSPDRAAPADGAPRPERIVDAHVHLWDPARVEWYPYLSGGRELNMGDTSGMARRFDPATHRHESAGWNVVALVNVAAATGRHSIDETLALDRTAAHEGQPAAIIGGLPPTATPAEGIELIERQATAGRFRGVRPMGRFEDPVPPDEVLQALADQGLIFELMAHPHQLRAAADRLASHPGLTVVIEHAGWPRNDSAEERALWEDGLATLASLGPHVLCKVSGLVMPLRSMQASVLEPWVVVVLECFGTQRCMFASNFPVDGLHGSFDELYGAYSAITAYLGPSERDAVFATNAERVYRC